MAKGINTAFILAVGFVAGLGFAHLSGAMAARNEAKVDVTHKVLAVTISEIKQTFVPFEEFAGSYKTTIRLSDGSARTIELTPTIHNGMELVQINDTGRLTYTALNGMQTNGSVMIQLRDVAAMNRQMCEQGWKFPSCQPE